MMFWEPLVASYRFVRGCESYCNIAIASAYKWIRELTHKQFVIIAHDFAMYIVPYFIGFLPHTYVQLHTHTHTHTHKPSYYKKC